jgi:hypothetical protein
MDLSSDWTLRCPSTSGRASATVERVMGAEEGMLVGVFIASSQDQSRVEETVGKTGAQFCGYARDWETYEESRLENVVAVGDHSG